MLGIDELGAAHVDAIRESNKRLIERAFEMRAHSYLSQVKSQLLTETVLEIDSSKKMLGEENRQLAASLASITRQKDELAREIAARQDAEEALRQAQKMEAVGHLTGGLAHDFNNLLTAVIGNLELMGDYIEPGSILEELKRNTESAARRGADITARLLAFSRKQNLAPRPTDVNLLVTGMKELFSGAVSEDVEIELALTKGLESAIVDPSQLENTLLNLVNNSRSAVPEGGTITIETSAIELDAKDTADFDNVAPGHYIRIEVRDTGAGISPEDLSQVFEPFFTTKDVGEGSGLGLSMVYGFIKQSGGQLSIESEVGHGTSVSFILPSVKWPEAGAAPPGGVQGKPSGTETILVVEDDDDVRALLTTALTRLGYRVIEAANGPAALAVLEDTSDIDLLLTDLVMPHGMNGRQIAEAVLARDPSTKVIYSSGYFEGGGRNGARLEEGMEFLGKPYDVSTLAAKVREVLDK